MIMQTKTFSFSKRFPTRHRRYVYILAATLMILALFTLLIEEDFDIQMFGASYPPIPLFIAIIMGFAQLLIIFIVVDRYISNQWRRSKLHIGPEGLAREAGGLRQTVYWDKITKVRFGHDPSGEPRTIEVFTAKDPPLVLFGFESMSEIAGLIRSGISPTAQVEIKRRRLGWENPFVTIATIIPGILAFILALEIIRRLGGQVNIVITLISMALAIYSLRYGALSRTNPNIRKFEIVICIATLVGGALLLILR